MKKYFEFEHEVRRHVVVWLLKVGEECGNGTKRKVGASNSMCNPVDKVT